MRRRSVRRTRRFWASCGSLWTGEERLLLSRCPNGVPYKQEFADVRDVVQGYGAGAGAGRGGGGGIHDWAGRRCSGGRSMCRGWRSGMGLTWVDARLPESNFFEFDLGKIKGLLGYEPRHDVRSVVETAERMFRGEEAGVRAQDR